MCVCSAHSIEWMTSLEKVTSVLCSVHAHSGICAFYRMDGKFREGSKCVYVGCNLGICAFCRMDSKFREGCKYVILSSRSAHSRNL